MHPVRKHALYVALLVLGLALGAGGMRVFLARTHKPAPLPDPAKLLEGTGKVDMDRLVEAAKTVKASGRPIDRRWLEQALSRVIGDRRPYLLRGEGTNPALDAIAFLQRIEPLLNDEPMAQWHVAMVRASEWSGCDQYAKAAAAGTRGRAIIVPQASEGIVLRTRVFLKEARLSEKLGRVEKADERYRNIAGYAWWWHVGDEGAREELRGMHREALLGLLRIHAGDLGYLERFPLPPEPYREKEVVQGLERALAVLAATRPAQSRPEGDR